jgi:uncharacterized protein YyaL (SSP411 family)
MALRHRATIVAAILLLATPARGFGSQAIDWQSWSDGIFARAKHEQRFVILDLQAVWCHWCHVMDQTTYRDPKVVGLIASKYIAVRADEDANPDLANRYGDWGWPATIVFGPDGGEIVKRRGYMPPSEMASMLQAIIDNPSPGPSVIPARAIAPAVSAILSPAQRKLILDRRAQIYDRDYGGWGKVHKFINVEDLEYAISQALAGDRVEEAAARRTLDAALNLLDPVGGGFYQYSDSRDWKSPHFEKIISIEAGYIRTYALAYAAWRRPQYLEAARRTAGYLASTLRSPEGAFYVSQDADVSQAMPGKAFYALDDAGRRKLSPPRIDNHLYARENGWAVSALAAVYDVTGDRQYPDQARTAANWVIANRSIAGGGFDHGAQDRAGPYLGDSLAMAQGFVALYESTADRVWLSHAERTLDFIDSNFARRTAGYVTAISKTARPPAQLAVAPQPYCDIDENIDLARLADRLFHFSGNARYRKMAERAMRYAASPQVTQDRFFLTGLLLADRELASGPLHVTIVGAKDDAAALGLYQSALAYPSNYERLEWWDKREGPMPNPDVVYPSMPQAAAFVCSGDTCSLPVFDPAKLTATIDRLKRPASG